MGIVKALAVLLSVAVLSARALGAGGVRALRIGSAMLMIACWDPFSVVVS